MNEYFKKNKKETGFTDARKMTFPRSSRYFGVGHSDLSKWISFYIEMSLLL